MRYNYDLFCQRKRFLIKNYFTIYPNSSYEDFCLFLTQRNVIPPSKEYFENQKESLFTKEESKPEVVKEVKKTRQRKSTKENQEKNKTLVEEVKKPRRRRRSAKKNDS